MPYKNIPKILILVIIVNCIFLGACSTQEETKKIEIGTDVEFVKEQFPKLEDIEEVEYFYNQKSDSREIGLQNIEFCGFIKIGDDFYNKITQEYEWKETKKAKKKVPKAIFMEGEDKGYHFTFNDTFRHDGKYISNSWIGEFFLDKEQKVLYFECEW